jgi:hypothetical protein
MRDPACLLPRLEEYVAYLKSMEAKDAKSREAVLDTKNRMCVRMITQTGYAHRLK